MGHSSLRGNKNQQNFGFVYHNVGETAFPYEE
jgi:hypothetical protein